MDGIVRSVVLPADKRIVRRFRAWREQGDADLGVCGDCLSALLEGRAAYLDRPDPTRWRRGDVRALLYDLAVPRLSEQCALVGHAVDAVDAFLLFLDQSGQLHPGSTAVRHLRQELAQCAAGFPAAMADRSRFRMAKTLYQAMIADGVRLHDYDTVDAWLEAFDRAPTEDRAVVLEHLLVEQPELLTAQFVARAGKVVALAPGQERFDSRELLPPTERVPDVLPSFAPVRVPSRAEAVLAVQQSVFLGRLVALARWFAPGRKVTKDGEPVPADVRELIAVLGLGLTERRTSQLGQTPNLRELFWLARQLELVELRRDGLAAGPRLAPWQDGDGATVPDEDLLELWRDVLFLIETGGEICDEALRTGRTPLSRLTERLGECIPAIVLALYEAAARDQDEELAPLLNDAVDKLLEGRRRRLRGEQAELLEGVLRVAICTSLVRLVEHGTLKVYRPAGALPPTGDNVGFLACVVLMSTDMDLRVRLTPLGRWATNQELRAAGSQAPAIETDATQDVHILEVASTELQRLAP